MRKISVNTFMTLDGVMQAPGGPTEDLSGGFTHGGWSFNHWDDVMNGVIRGAMEEQYDLLLGRRTYDIFAAHWPNAGDNPVTHKFNAITKYVATHRPDSLTWQNSQALQGDTVAAVRALKAGDGPMLSVQGSQGFLQTLIGADLVDDYNLWIFPVLLGSGRKLFADGTVPGGLRLVSTTVSTTGVIVAKYECAPFVAAGSFELEK